MTISRVRMSLVSLAAVAAVSVAAVPATFMDGGTAAEPSAFRGEGDGHWNSLFTRLEGGGQEVSVLVSDWNAMWSPAPGLFIVAAPDQVQDADPAVLERLLDGGSSVLVVDPEGALNRWVRSYGVAVSTLPLVDIDPPMDGGVRLADAQGREVWAHSPGSLLLDEEGWEPVLRSVGTAYLDLDRDGNVDETDRPGPFVVAASRRLPSGGTLAVSADRTHLTDGLMAAGPGNAQAAEDLVSSLAAGGAIVLDESHLSWDARERWPAASTKAASLVAGIGLISSVLLLAMFLAGGVQAATLVKEVHPFAPHLHTDPVTLPRHPGDGAGMRNPPDPELDHHETDT